MSTILIGPSPVDIDANLEVILDDVEERAPFVVSLVRAGTNPSAAVTGLDWTVGQLGSHLASGSDRYGRMAEGEAVVNTSVSERRTAIDSGIDEHLHETASEQADVVQTGTTRLVAALRGKSDDDRLPYYGMEVPPWLIAGMHLGELLVHGVDLARTYHRSPEVPDRARTARCWFAARSRPPRSPRGVRSVRWCSAPRYAAIRPSSPSSTRARSG